MVSNMAAPGGLAPIASTLRSLITGSYNWSTAGEESNDENAMFIRDSAVVAAYQAGFNALWH